MQDNDLAEARRLVEQAIELIDCSLSRHNYNITHLVDAKTFLITARNRLKWAAALVAERPEPPQAPKKVAGRPEGKGY